MPTSRWMGAHGTFLERGGSLQRRLRRCLRHRCTRLPGFEVRDYMLAKEANGMEHFLVLGRSHGAQQNCLLDAERFV